MAETSKRTTNNSTSKSRKSKNEIIRSKLGTYLKQNKYSVSLSFDRIEQKRNTFKQFVYN